MKRTFGICLFSMMAVCSLFFAHQATTAATVTYSKDVAPIIQKNCMACHRPGEVAPMPLTSYAEVRPWSKAIREEVVERTMPPWFADPNTSTVHFSNDRRLSEQEIKTITTWEWLQKHESHHHPPAVTPV